MPHTVVWIERVDTSFFHRVSFVELDTFITTEMKKGHNIASNLVFTRMKVFKMIHFLPFRTLFVSIKYFVTPPPHSFLLLKGQLRKKNWVNRY